MSQINDVNLYRLYPHQYLDAWGIVYINVASETVTLPSLTYYPCASFASDVHTSRMTAEVTAEQHGDNKKLGPNRLINDLTKSAKIILFTK